MTICLPVHPHHRATNVECQTFWASVGEHNLCLTWWSTDSYQNKLDNSSGHETNVCVQMDAPRTHLCTFSEKFNIFHCYIYIVQQCTLLLSPLFFCLNFVMGRWLTNCTSIICSLLFFLKNACKPSSNLIPVKPMRLCQGKFWQATWPKKEQQRVKWNSDKRQPPSAKLRQWRQSRQ